MKLFLLSVPMSVRPEVASSGGGRRPGAAPCVICGRQAGTGRKSGGTQGFSSGISGREAPALGSGNPPPDRRDKHPEMALVLVRDAANVRDPPSLCGVTFVPQGLPQPCPSLPCHSPSGSCPLPLMGCPPLHTHRLAAGPWTLCASSAPSAPTSMATPPPPGLASLPR